MAVATRKQSFRDGKPVVDLVDDLSATPELQANKNLSGGRDLARPLVPGVVSDKKGLGGRRGRKGRSR